MTFPAEMNPLRHLHLGDRGTIPLAAGGRGAAEIIAYRGVGDARWLYCRLLDAPDTVLPVRPEQFRRLPGSSPRLAAAS